MFARPVPANRNSVSFSFVPGLALPKGPGALTKKVSGGQIDFGCISVQLADGGSFMLPSLEVLRLAAQRVAVGGTSVQAHLDKQLIPAVQDDPGILVEIVRSLGWDSLKDVAFGCWWVTPLAAGGPDLALADIALSNTKLN